MDEWRLSISKLTAWLGVDRERLWPRPRRGRVTLVPMDLSEAFDEVTIDEIIDTAERIDEELSQ